MSVYQPLVAACARALRPLQRAVVDADAFRQLLQELGWDLAPTLADLGELQRLVPIADIDRAVELATQLATTGELTIDELADMVAALDAVATAVAALSELTADDLGGFGPDLADPELWADLATVLAEYLLLRLLDQDAPLVTLVLRLGGVIHWEVRGYSARIGRWRIAWDQVPDLLTDPLGSIQTTIGWGSTFSAARVLGILRIALSRLGIGVALAPLADPVRAAITAAGDGDASTASQTELVIGRGADGIASYEVGIVVASAATADEPNGIYVGNLCVGRFETGTSFGDWSLDVVGEVDGMATAGAVIRPGRTTPITSIPSGEVSIGLVGTPEVPWRLIGSATGTRVELSGLELRFGVTVDPSESELWGSIGTIGDGLSIVIDLGGSDNFLSSIIGDAIPTIDIAGSLRLGSRTGLTVTGGLGLSVVIPVERQIGPLYVSTLDVEIGGTETGIDLGLAIDADIVVGPFTATIGGLGASVSIVPGASARFAGLESALAFVPPNRIGFQIDTEAVHGGGFVEIDADIGRYAGALSLDIVAIGIDAIIVIDTQLPGDPSGWALFASLAASFPGIPLGFGFTLNGVGGLLALNRTMDAEALASGLRSGVIDALLFPDDPVNDSAELIAQIDEYFPLRDGSTVIGPVIEIGWGSPTLITGQLGVVISLPDGVIAVMGSVEAILPTPDAPVLTLHLDSLGVIDLAAGTFSLTASLYDSHLLETIDLGGDMAMYLQIGAQPYFLLSVGGYHPGFEPPSIVPAAMHDLRRMQASIEIASNVSISIQAYFAVTSNSVQFGSSVNVVASVEIWPATYTAKGWFSFDVLLVFSPFTIVATMSAGVGIYSGDKELMGVQLHFQLEGPKPWYAVGTASFKFFGLNVNFELEVGGKAAGQPKPIAHPRAEVLDALALPSSWSEVAPTSGWVAGITYAAITSDPSASGDETVWVRPDHSLAVRQSVAPLNRTLAIVGQAIPASGEELITVTDAKLGGSTDVAWEFLDDWFAPAQFEVLDRTAKLTRASFELMTAGVTFGSPEAAIAADTDLFTSVVATVYDSETWEPDGGDQLGHSVRTGAIGVGTRHFAGPAPTPRFTVAPTAYTLARTADGATATERLRDAGLATTGVSQYEAMQARTAAISDDEGQAARLVMVPVTAALEPTA